MMVDPPATPLTKPVVGFTVAIKVLSLLQLPPTSPVLVNDVAAPAHTVAEPLTVPAFGSGLMVILAEATALPQLPLTV